MYAGTHGSFAHPDERVTPLLLDVTDAAHTRQAAERVPALDVHVNNAGVASHDDLEDPRRSNTTSPSTSSASTG